MSPPYGYLLVIPPGAPVEFLVEVTPDPSKVVTFSTSGLELGGVHTWKYTYRFGGLIRR